MFRNIAIAALFVLTQGCQQPVTAADNATNVGGMPASRAVDVDLSFWGIGVVRERGAAVGGAASVFSGTLARIGGCLVLASENGTRVHPVFPSGTATWDAVAGTLVLAGKRYRLGDRIAVGGGGVASPSRYAQEPGVHIADCAVDALFVVIA